MAVHSGLLLTGFIVKTILGGAVVVALVWLFWKVGKLADAYRKQLKEK